MVKVLRRVGLEVLAVGVPLAMVFMAQVVPFAWSIPTALVACAALPLRLKWPWPAVLLCLPALIGGLGWPAAVVALYRTGRVTRDVRVVSACVLLTTTLPALFVIVNERMGLNQILLTLSFTFFMSAAPAALGALITARQELTRSLEETRRARSAELAAREESARSAERARIAREIHDAVGHHATLIAVESAALAATTSEEQTRQTALRLRALAKETLAEMRAALGLLNAPRQPAEGYDDLPRLVDRARAAGLAVRLDDRPGAELPPSVGRAVYRVVQEALTNVTKHAPGAAVQARLARQDDRVVVTVVNGPPTSFAPPSTDRGGTGLHGLSERVRMVGGTLSAEPRPDGGFAVEARLPAGNPTGTPKVDEEDSTFGGSARDAANA